MNLAHESDYNDAQQQYDLFISLLGMPPLDEEYLFTFPQRTQHVRSDVTMATCSHIIVDRRKNNLVILVSQQAKLLS